MNILFLETILWQSGSQKLDFLKWQQLHSSRQVDFSDNHDVTNLETRFLFRPHFLTNMLSELVLVLQSPYLKGTSFAKPFRVSRSAAFDCHESQIYRDTATFVDPSEWQVLG